MLTTIEQLGVKRGRVSADHPDLQMFYQDRYQKSYGCILFPPTSVQTVDFIESLNTSPNWLTDEERIELADEEAVKKPTLQQRLVQMKATLDGQGALDLTQRLFPLKHLAQVLWHCQNRDEHYLAQNSFQGWQRSSSSVNQITSCWVDLDFYKLKSEEVKAALADDGQAVLMVLALCREGLGDRRFLPSQIVRSGRGLYVKWIFSHFLPGVAAPRWRRCMEAIIERFTALGSDPRARDAARVLRVVGSRNSKSRTLVQTIHTGAPIFFDLLAAALLPRERASASDRWAAKTLTASAIKRFGKKAQTTLEPKTKTLDHAHSWPALVAAELIHLALMRGQSARGHIELLIFTHMNFQLMCKNVLDRVDFENQVQEIGLLVGANLGQLKGKVMNLWQRHQAGQHLYLYKKSTLISLLEITAEELIQLPCLAKSAGSRERKPTVQTRGELEEKQQRALLMERSGMQLKDIAIHFNVSPRTVKRWLLATH